MPEEIRAVLDTLPGLVWTALPEGIVDFVNRRWCEYTGVSFAESCAFPGWQAAFHPEDLPGLLAEWARVLPTGATGQVEARMRRFDGQYRRFLIRATPIRDAEDRITKWYGVNYDIEDQTGMPEELRSVLDTLPGLVWTAQPDGNADFVNQHYCEYTGTSFAENTTSGGWQAAVHPDDLPALIAEWQRVLPTGDTGEVEARMRRHDGQYRLFVIRANPIRDAAGRVIKWYGLNSDVEDQTRAEHALRARALDLRTLLDSCPIPVAVMSAEGELQGINRHIEEYFGKTLEELKDWETADWIHPDDLPRTIDAWRRACATGHPYETEHRYRRVDGVYRWFHSRGLPLRAEGRIARWVLVHTDIEERKRADSLLADENQLLEMIARGAPLPAVLDALCTLVETGAGSGHCSVLLVDGHARFRHGGAPSLPPSYNQAVEGKPVHGEVGACGMAASTRSQVIVSDVATDPRWLHTEWRDLALAHGLRSCWSTPILSGDQRILGTFAVYQREPGSPTPLQQDLIRQFTHVASIAIERANSEEGLRRSEAFLAEAQHLSSTGSFWWRVAAEEIAWSKEMYRILELDPSFPVTLERIASRIHPDDMPIFHDMLRRANGDGSDFEYVQRLLMLDNRIKYIRLVGHATRDQDGQLLYIGAAQDITANRRSEEALERIRSELARVSRVTSLGALTASIAHEVSQPLSGVVTNASTCLRMLGGDTPNVAGALETVRRIVRDGNRAADVITRLRALFGGKRVSAESVDLNDATREVLALTSNELQRSRVIVTTELDAALPSIAGDRIQLQQVILNLLLNAVEAMKGVDERPKRLLIRTERDGHERVRLEVRDAGVGFEARDADKLFEAFYTTKSGGMGIGLSVSRSIIERHQGRLWATSNEGPGATFSFSIPCAQLDVAVTRGADAISAPVVTDATLAPRSS